MAAAKKATAKQAPAKKATAPRRTPRPKASDAPRFAVIGTGRSGTGYIAAVMQANDINCGHEGWFKPDDRTPALDGDSSWLALPDIESGAWEGPVAHVVRNPVSVVRSLVGIKFFDAESEHEPYPQFARERCPEVRDLPPLEAAVEWWVAWNERCAKVADVKLRVEDLARHDWALAELGEALSVTLDPAKSRTVARNTNSRKRAPVPEQQVWDLLDGRARRFGYPI